MTAKGFIARLHPRLAVAPAHPPLRWLVLSLVVIVADQFIKLLVLYYLKPYARIEILPVLNITLLYNRGAAFSMLAGQNGWQQWLFVVLAVVFSAAILVWLRRLPAHGRTWLAAGLALILGGALGNAIDRVWHGHVIDFIDVHWHTWHFWAFNVADSAITVGAIMAIADSLFHKRPEPPAEESDMPADSGPQ